MSIFFKLESKPPIKDLQGRFSKANNGLLEHWRDVLREQGRRFVDFAGEESPGGPGHTVARGITFKTFNVGNSINLQVYPGKVGRWHIEGTGIYGPRGQLIRPRRAKALRFTIDGEILFRAWVRGIRPNKFFGRAYRRWLPGARKAIRRVALGWVRTLRGQAKVLKP